MTVAALPPSIVYNENGVTLSYAIPFRFKDPTHIKAMRVAANGTLTLLSYGADYSVSGGATDSGGTLKVGIAGAVGVRLMITRLTPRSQPMDYTTGDTFPAESHEGAIDRLTLIAQELDVSVSDLLGRAVLAAFGESGGVLPPAAEIRGKFLARDADDDWIGASGTGADGALRTDLAGVLGALLIGVAGGGSLQAKLNAIDASLTAASANRLRDRRAYATVARAFVPYAEVMNVAVGDLMPTQDALPIASMRLHADWELHRVRTAALAGATPLAGPTSGLYFDEYLVHKPSVNSFGRQCVMHRAYYDGRYADWNVPVDNAGLIDNADFAARLCRQDLPYHSGGEGPAAYYTGPGHEHFNIPSADVQMSHAAKAGNLAGIGNWAVGEKLYGATATIEMPTIKLGMYQKTYANNPMTTTNGSGVVRINDPGHGYITGRIIEVAGATGFNGINGSALAGRFAITVVDANNYTITALNANVANASGAGGGAVVMMFDDAVNLSHTMSFGAAFGRRNTFEFQALLPNVAIQDSYFAMFPISHLWASHLKFGGLAAIGMPKDLSVYPVGGGNTGAAAAVQAFSSTEPQSVKQMVLEYAGADGFATPLRSGGPQPAFNAWFYNKQARGIVVFGGESAKGYFHSHSSELDPPRTAWPLVVGNKFQAQVSEKTSWLPGGAI